MLACAGLGVLLVLTACGNRDQPATGSPPEPTLQPIAAAASNDPFASGFAIWPHSESPQPHEVALFRRELSLPTAVEEAELRIFADTRYEAWVDGQWIGRGPARFSAKRHEYDVVPLADLAAGAHTVAILAQWAPNHRRSKSSQPHLIAEIRGETDGITQVLASTDGSWRAIHSPAWRMDAVPVHEWGILGPTELLDLRSLPQDWTQPGFDDGGWPTAVTRTLEPAPLYAERSIPALVEAPIPATLLDAGLLSPGSAIVQLEQSDTLTLEAPPDGAITVEIPVDAADGHPVQAFVDDEPVLWRGDLPDNPTMVRPDVVQAELSLDAGQHTLSFEPLSVYGLPVSVFPAAAVHSPATLIQGNHAGRRLLLAEPVTDRNVSSVEKMPGDSSMAIDINASPAYLVLDLGRVVHGRLYAEITGPEGTVVDIGWDERLFEDSLRPLPHPGTLHPQWNQVDSWVLDGDSRTISTIDARAGRYVLIAVWGAPVQLRNLRILEERYPVEERGWFRSSNPRLDEIWQLGVNTAYPSMQDAYADAWRERGQWWGDAYVVDHINQVVFGDSLLLRRGLLAIADEADADGSLPAFAPNSDNARMLDYGMLWVQSAQDYVERTGDVTFAQSMLPTVSRFLQHVETLRRPDTDLLDIPVGHWSETALVDWAGTKSRHGQSTVLNSLYVQTLRDAAFIASAAGEPAVAKEWETRADVISQAINEQLFLPDQNRFATSILDGEIITPSTHAQVWPLAFDLVPDDLVDTVANAALDPFHVEIFGMFWALKGLGRAGYISEAVQLVEERYGALLDKGATTLWEHWNSDQRYDAALSHGWGGAPTWFLSTYVLGVSRTGPMSWELRPTFEGVEWVEGAIPLAHGEVTARWEMVGSELIGCDEHTVTVSSPADSTGTIVLPLDDLTAVDVNGNEAWANGQPTGSGIEVLDGMLHYALPGGDATLRLTAVCRE